MGSSVSNVEIKGLAEAAFCAGRASSVLAREEAGDVAFSLERRGELFSRGILCVSLFGEREAEGEEEERRGVSCPSTLSAELETASMPPLAALMA